MIYFDEKSIAERMHETQSFEKTYCTSELAIYAKWLRYKKSVELGKDLADFTAEENATTDTEIERELIAFAEKAYPSFNYTVNYVEIDNALDISRKFRLKLPNPTPITENEWNSIMTIENDNYRRVLFIALVDAKYYSMNHTTIGKEEVSPEHYWNRMPDDETLKLAKTNLKTQYEKGHVWYVLFQGGYIGMTPGRHHIPYTNIIDTQSNVIDYVTDYEHLDLHYEKLLGENIGQCKHCGKLFRQNKNGTSQYCYQHRGYRKKIIANNRICVVCGKSFEATAYTKRDMCSECYKKHRNKIKNQSKLKN